MHNASLVRVYIYTYIYSYNQYTTSSHPLVTSSGGIHISVYRKLRGGSVKSSAANGKGQTYAETWEIAPLFSAIHSRFMHGLAKSA